MEALAGLDVGRSHAGAHGKAAMTIGPEPALGSAASGNGTRERRQAVGLTGSCLCGALRYEADRLDMPMAHCQCRTCRKAHVSAFATTAGVLRGHFRWLAGEDRLRTFEFSPSKRRWFCSGCGTHLVAERPAQPHVILRVATLDDDLGARPAMHIWTMHDPDWLHDPKDVPRYPEWEPGR